MIRRSGTGKQTGIGDRNIGACRGILTSRCHLDHTRKHHRGNSRFSLHSLFERMHSRTKSFSSVNLTLTQACMRLQSWTSYPSFLRSEHTDRNVKLKPTVLFTTLSTHIEIGITWCYRKPFHVVFPPCKASNPIFIPLLFILIFATAPIGFVHVLLF